MKTITLAIEDAILDGVRFYTAKHVTTLNDLVRDYRSRLAARENNTESARQRLLELIDGSQGDMVDQKWDRDSLYDLR